MIAVTARTAAVLGFAHPPVLRHRIVLEDLALEYPHLHAVGAIGGHRGGGAVIDVGPQSVERNAAFAIPLGAGDLRAAEPAGASDLDALRAHTLRRLNGALHRPA